MGYTQISIDMSEALNNATADQIHEAGNAFLEAAYTMREDARSLFVNNSKGYKLTPLKDAIRLHAFMQSEDIISIKLDCLGLGSADPTKEQYKARFFVQGTKPRFTNSYAGKPLNSPSYKNSLPEIDAIVRALNETILIQKVQSRLDQNK